MVVGELCRDVGRAHAQEIGAPGASAEKQQQLGGLEILEVGDAVEQVLVLLVCLAELVLDEGAGADGCSQDGESPGRFRQVWIAHPHVFSEFLNVWWWNASCVPHTGFAAVELDAGLALERVGENVVDWADSVGWHHNV